MKFAIVTAIALLHLPAFAQDANRLTDVSKPQAAYQVIQPDQIEKIYSAGQALTDMKQRLDSIDTSIKEMRVDIKVLMDANVLFGFFVGCAKLLFPGLIIAAFSIWLARFLNKKPARARS